MIVVKEKNLVKWAEVGNVSNKLIYGLTLKEAETVRFFTRFKDNISTDFTAFDELLGSKNSIQEGKSLTVPMNKEVALQKTLETEKAVKFDPALKQTALNATESQLENFSVDPTYDGDLSKYNVQTKRVGESENIKQCSEEESATVFPIPSTEPNYTRDNDTVDPLSEPHQGSFPTSANHEATPILAIGSSNEEQFKTHRDPRKQYFDEMVDFYVNTVGNSLKDENEKKKQNQQKKFHSCIAALICHPPKEAPYVAVLCTGTKTNHQECYSTGDEETTKDRPCDGHAESLCYEVFPLYLQREMLNYLEKKQSIFTFENDSFTLKPHIEFHLLVTEPPCGWIRYQQDPCMEWKKVFEKAPHIPTCSSRILIGSKMGIQGYVSQLLKECIFIKSLVILCAKNEEYQKTEFNSSLFPFDLPTISTLKYDPNEFNPRVTTFKPMNLVELPDSDQSNQKKVKRLDDDSDDHEGKNQKDYKCDVAIYQSAPHNSTMKWSYNPREGSENDENNTKEKFSVLEKIIKDKLSEKVTDKFQVERKMEIKEQYNELTDLLNVSDALQKLIKELNNYNDNKKKILQKSKVILQIY